MERISSVVSWWFPGLAVAVPLALLLFLALPRGLPAEIAMHAVLLVGGAAIVLALQPRDDG